MQTTLRRKDGLTELDYFERTVKLKVTDP